MATSKKAAKKTAKNPAKKTVKKAAKKATAKKAAKKVAAKKTAPKKGTGIKKANIIKAVLKAQFFSGVGKITATQFRNGATIQSGTIINDGSITFDNSQRGDVISINGSCAGTARISIDVSTDPKTPETFSKNINAGYDIL